MLAPHNHEAIASILAAGFVMDYQNPKHYTPASGWYGLFREHPRVVFSKDYRSIELSLENTISDTTVPKGEVTFTFGDRIIYYDQQLPGIGYINEFISDSYNPWI